MQNKKIAFFGTPDFSVIILNELKKKGILPELIITAPDRPKGRGLIMTPPPVKVWAEVNSIEYIQPEKLDINFLEKIKGYDLFIVAAYGKILKKEVLDIPKFGTLNVHPSLLPKFRGSSPIEGAILSGEKITGVSIMLLDEEMDHGPILGQEDIELNDSVKASNLESELAIMGGALLAETIPLWIKGIIKGTPQRHEEATYTKKIKKEDGEINLNDDGELNYRKFRAYDIWPGIHFFIDNNEKEMRLIVKDAELKDGKFKIKRVVPEGKKDISYDEFLGSLKK